MNMAIDENMKQNLEEQAMDIIPFDDRDGTIWLNGEMVDWREAKTHTLSHGLALCQPCIRR